MFIIYHGAVSNRYAVTAGEVVAEDICVECSVGTYSFDSGVPCQSCPEGAACYGANRHTPTLWSPLPGCLLASV